MLRRWHSYESSPNDNSPGYPIDLTRIVYQPDPISSLPVEIFDLVMEAVGDKYQRSRLLRALARASRTLEAYVQPRLWQRFHITDAGAQRAYPFLREFGARGKYIADRCAALTRQAGRAACVQHLSISISSKNFQGSDSSHMTNLIIEALKSVPSLDTLRLHVESDNNQTAKHLIVMMNRTSFPFRLRVFTGDLLMEPEIFPFLAGQNSIEQYSVTCGKMSPKQNKATRITKDFPTIPGEFLPNLRRYTGHTLYAPSLMQHRTFDLVTLFVYWRFLVPDIQVANQLEGVPVDETWLGSASAVTLVLGDLVPLRQPIPLSTLLSHIYGISPRNVRDVKVVGTIHWAGVLNFRLLEPESLLPLSELKTLECVCQEAGTGTWEMFTYQGQIAVTSRRFIQRIAEVSPSLERVVISVEEGYQEGMVFQRVIDDSRELVFGMPGHEHDEDPKSERIQLPSGLTWLLKIYR